MNTKIIILLAAAIMIPSTFLPNAALAVEALSVKKDDDSCLSTTSTCFKTIQLAIDYANGIISTETVTPTTFTIQVEAGDYPENITIGTGILSLKGRETARTKLTGSGTLITINGGNPIISNLYFQNAAVGIDITNSATATITNNIFDLGLSGTAILLSASSTQTKITNNTFHSNNIAISNAGVIPIKNNIFHANNTIPALPDIPASDSLVAYNDFFANTGNPSIAQQGDGAGNISGNPLFVNSGKGDFHLQIASPCIDSGLLTSTSIDMGAYGGTDADTIPVQVDGVTAVQDVATSVISVNWSQNLDYKIIGYRVWYGKTAGGPYDGTGAAEGTSPISVQTGTVVSATVSGLTATVSKPATPELYPLSPLNEGLNVSWSDVGVTKYRVYYSESPIDPSALPSTFVEVGNTTSTILPNLINGVVYYVAVTAIAEAAYYVAVTATYSGSPLEAGMSNESAYSTEASVGAGEPQKSDISNIMFDFPEALVGYPNLPDSNKDCFIATAAYGHYSAPQVRALRKFRDQYLLTNRIGSAFVRWYYEYGPVAAAYLEAHPGYKPVVRVALLPAVGTALFMTSTPLFIKALFSLFLLIFALMTLHLVFRKRLSGSGGTH